MDELPSTITSSSLWRRLSGHNDLEQAVVGLRETASVLATKVEHVLPEFTDHSVRHMDALWGVAQKVLTDEEMQRVGPGEAFILAASFYIHDLGMSVGATEEGRSHLESSESFNAALGRLKQIPGMSELYARECSLKIAARESHSKLAESYVDEIIPGLDRFLIESIELRRQWGAMIGQVSASHHWSLRTVEERLGKRGLVPDPSSDASTIDLGFLACALRIIDYAHINSGRARLLDRVLRADISPAGLMHWQAQEHISGPNREESLLVYASTRPVESVDGWWTFFEMIRGLVAEIEAVSEYLAARKVSGGRFSLKGIKGATSAQQFGLLVETSGFEPIDVRFKPDSMDRLIQLLGGRTLYGDDDFAALRELLQNAADAVRLRRAVESTAEIRHPDGEIIVSIDTSGDKAKLVVSDDGVGMSERVITNYLLGIASDYWHSPDFFADHPKVYEQGFRPVGRFGIGFLSVFMLGDEVIVDTQRHGGGQALQLTLQGIGRRGALKRRPPSLRYGTSVKVVLSPEYRGAYASVHRVVQARAPMLDVSITVSDGDVTTNLQPGWWKSITQEEFSNFLIEQRSASMSPRRMNKYRDSRYFMYGGEGSDLRSLGELLRWPGKQPEIISERHRILAVPTMGHVLLCSKGFAIRSYPLSGLMGLVNEQELQLNAARTMPLEWDSREFRTRLLTELDPHIQSAVDGLQQEPNIPARYGFLCAVAKAYGPKYLTQTGLAWITLIEPPGNTQLFSPEKFKEKIRHLKELVVGYGPGPWGIADSVRSFFPEVSQRNPLIPISTVDQSDVRSGDSYDEGKKLLKGSLRKHFTSKHQAEDEMFENARFLNIVLDLIAAAWQVRRDQLDDCRWCSQSGKLCGYLTK